MRVKFTIPEGSFFSTELPVRITDINYGGHLGNDAVLRFVHEARVQFLATLKCSELDVGENVSLIMADAAVMYRSEAFYGDVVTISVTVGEISDASFELYFNLTEKQSKKELARVKTGMVAFNYKERTVAKLPPSFIQLLDAT